METWFLNHVLGLSLSVLLLGLPGPLGAGTPSNNSADPVTEGFYYSAATDEVSTRENNATSTSYSSESLSPSQRSLLLTHTAETHAATAANLDTKQTQTFTETSSRTLEAISLSTEPLASTLVTPVDGSSSSSTSSSSSSGSSNIGSSSTSSSSIGSSSSSSSSTGSSSSSSSSDWKDFTNTDQMPGTSHAVSWEARPWMFTDDASMPQDSPDTTLRLGDATALVSQTAVLTDSTYTTTISRAGERTLLSVTSSSSNSSTSAFTEDSNSHQPPSTWGIPPRHAETEVYTHSAPSTRTDGRETTDEHSTESFSGVFSETGSPAGSRGTQSLTGHPSSSQHEQTSTSEQTSDSTPPLRVTEPSTDRSEVSVSSTPPFTSPAGGLTNVSGTDQGSDSSVGTSTESSTGARSSSTQNQEGTEGFSTQTRDGSVGLGLTAVPSTVSSSTSEIDDPLTERPVLLTEVFLTTTPVTVTERLQTTEEDTFKASAFTTTATTTTATITSALPATSSSWLSSSSSSSTPQTPTEATIPYTAPSTTASTPVLHTSEPHPTHHVSPSQTQGPSTGIATPTRVTTLRTETSTGTQRTTTSRSLYVTTSYTHSSPTKTTEALQTTRKQTDGETTELAVTTSPTDAQPTKVPPPPPRRNPCVSNPCMNGGMCVSYERHQFTCQCQQAWTGTTCNQDVDECEQDPCPAGSKCVNTRGSFSCECPLGFDLEDGRTCTRAKTFLGTFSVNRLPHDPAVLKSTIMHEIQREILQLLNMSLSVLRGYSRSTLSKKEEDGVRILAVNMFSISTDVTTAEVYNSIQMSLSNCSSSLAHCRMVLHHQLTYHDDT